MKLGVWEFRTTTLIGPIIGLHTHNGDMCGVMITMLIISVMWK